MRALLVAGLALLTCVPLGAQQASAPATKLFSSASDVTAMIARAKAERKPDQANFIQPILTLAPYSANLEYRVAGINANAAIHEGDAEMFLVVEGAGTIVTGGTLREARRTNAQNLSGVGIDGGQSRRIAKGDFVIVPEGTPHWFGEIEETLVLMSVHLPHSVAK
jgi:mannose-6-phosphate isomerase-like protein (cupin superfamily)